MQSLPFIAWCLRHLNYWVITLLMAIESSFIPFPSEVVVPPAAYLAASGSQLNVFLVVLCATIGALIGAIVNYDTIPQFKCKAIAGAANNVILDDECGIALKKKGIVYAPDFIINGGGVINAGQEAFTTYDKENVLKQVHNIYNTVYNILEESKATGEPEGVIAQRFAENRIKNGL